MRTSPGTRIATLVLHHQGGEMLVHHVNVRDVVRNRDFDLASTEEAMRVPYDLFNPAGPVLVRGDLINYLASGELRTGRAVRCVLGDTRPGERVLLRLPPTHAVNEWWLCEVTAVDDFAAD